MIEKFNSQLFTSKQKFYDDTNFPNGFHRSGDFSIAEANILTYQGSIMTKLHKGEMVSTCSEHKRFLDVVNGTITAESHGEKSYLKYLHVLKNKHKYISPLTKVKAKN